MDFRSTAKFLVLVLLAALLPGMGCGRRTRPVIAVIPKDQSQAFWKTARAGALSAGRDLGVEIRWNGPSSEADLSRQIRIVDEFIVQRVDGIALAPVDGEALVPIVERAIQERIPVTIFDSGIRSDRHLAFVGTDNYRGGVLAAERMASQVNPGAKVAILGTVPGSVSTAEREKGFRETIDRKYPAVQIVDFQYGMADPARSASVAEGILTVQADLAGFFCTGEWSTLGAVRAVQGKAIRSMTIIGFDASPELVEALRAGRLDSLLVQNPFRMGYLAVQTLAEHLRGEVPARNIDTGVTLVTRDNLEDPAVSNLLNPPPDGFKR